MKNLKNTYYLLRHAEVDRSQSLDFWEYELSEEGKNQAERLIPFLEELSIDLIYSSPFKRAIQTIKPFAEKNGFDIEIKKQVSGRLVGDLPREKTWEFFENSWKDFNYTIHNAESAQDCLDRVRCFIEEIESLKSDKRVLLVSHSNPIAFYLSHIDKSINFQWFKNMKTPFLYKVSSHGNSLFYQQIDFLNCNDGQR